MVAAPHTSNWDFFYTRVVFNVLRIPLRFTIKKEWMRFPLNLFMRPMGGLAIDRSPKVPGGERRSMVDVMTEMFIKHPGKFVMLVTPEGSRSRRDEWKTGFYYVAVNAAVPIALGFLDYKKKQAGVGKIIYPTGNLEADMKEIMAFYKTVTPKFPANFSTDKRYDH
jgi:1-acyl-sn-glycerol-3-phosphate acyltransferase